MKSYLNCRRYVFLKIFICALMFMSTHAFSAITGYRGEILYFTDNYLENKSAYRYYPDGVLYVDNGKVVESGQYNALKGKYPQANIIDYRGKFIVPGFIDTHVHYPQTEMLASYGSQLLDWLQKDVFPTEMKFSEKNHAQKIANFFLDQLISNGTTTALVFATTYPQSVDAFFEAAQTRNLRMISGKVLMDRNAPDILLDTPERAYQDSEALIKKWHNKYRLKYAVTPRFAITSSREELQVARDLVKKYPDIYVHTHIAENKQELASVKQLFPESLDYLDVYKTYDLVTPRSVFAHAVHLSEIDFQTLREYNAAVAFCPMSNLFLGSGLFNFNSARKNNVKIGLGTDMGGGDDLSLLRTMNEAYKVTMMRKVESSTPNVINPATPMENLYLATLGGARALDLDDYIGSFLPGKEADFVVLDSTSKPLLNMRVKEATTLAEKVFAIEMLGDDRTVLHTYIMGKKMK